MSHAASYDRNNNNNNNHKSNSEQCDYEIINSHNSSSTQYSSTTKSTTTTTTFNSNSNSDSHTYPNTSSRWEAILRSIGAGVIYSTFVRKDDKEQPKVAIWKSRTVASTKLFIHLLSLAPIVVLVFFNLYGYYLGGEITGPKGHDVAKVNTLQFAAKIHETAMLASLETVVSTVVQSMALKSSVAFGFLFANIEFSKFSFLWSKQLWGMMSAQWKKPWGKALVPFIILVSILSLLVGPSSAVLMIPKLDDWESGGTDFWLNATRQQLWPQTITAAQAKTIDPACAVDNTKNGACPHAGWQAFAGGSLPGFRSRSERDPIHTYVAGEVSLFGKYGYRAMHIVSRPDVAVTVASGPVSTLSDALALTGMLWSDASTCSPKQKNFGWRNSAQWTISGVQQPLSRVSCVNTESDGSRSAQITDIVQSLFNSSRPELVWADVDESFVGNYSLGVLVTLPAGVAGNVKNIAMTCIVNAHWLDVEYIMMNEQKADRTWTVRPNHSSFYDQIEQQKVQPSLPPITISTEWARYLNPRIRQSNQTIFEQLIISAGIWDNDKDSDERATAAIESIVASMVANGLSNLTPSVDIQGSLPTGTDQGCSDAWVKPLMPQGRRGLGPGGAFWNLTGVDTTKMTKFTMAAKSKGYAFFVDSPTTIAAVVILILFGVIALCHGIITFYTGWSCSSWDSVPELMALAMQSTPTETLHGTGAGITSTGVFKEDVCLVQVNRNVRLQFSDTKGKGYPLEEDIAYG